MKKQEQQMSKLKGKNMLIIHLHMAMSFFFGSPVHERSTSFIMFDCVTIAGYVF